MESTARNEDIDMTFHTTCFSRRNPEHPRPQGGGFTLIELLVVIAIIGILLTILFPMIGDGIWQAKRASCATNIRQIMNGAVAISLDREDILPQARPTSGGVQKAFNPPEIDMWRNIGFLSADASGVLKSKVFACPDRDYEPSYEARFGQMVIGYQYFAGLQTWNLPSGRITSRSPVHLGDAEPGWAFVADAVGRIDGAWGAGRSTAYQDMPPHRKGDPWPYGGNVGFVDNSVRWILFDEMFKFHSWSWGGARDYYCFQEDTGTYVPGPSDMGINNKF